MTREPEATQTAEKPSWRERLRAPGARFWYIGGGSGLVWQCILVITVVLGPLPVQAKVGGIAILLVLYAVFMVLGPLVWPERTGIKVVVVLAYWVATFVLFPVIGANTIWVWLVVVSAAAFVELPFRFSTAIAAVVVAAQVGVAVLVRFADGIVFAPVVTAIGAITFVGLGFVSRSNRNLKLAHEEIARLAVVEERARFGRDLHDVLGHSLTVVTVKSDLARRLVKIDPDRAEAEIADIEQLTRSALADLRLAVANYREITLDSELAAAGTALAAAGIAAELPATAAEVDPRLQGVFAWVLREGVTNVIRHSGASTCWVTVGPDHLTVADDGRGPETTDAVARRADGNGLRGLRERTAEIGATLQVGRSSRGGFELTARAAA